MAVPNLNSLEDKTQDEFNNIMRAGAPGVYISRNTAQNKSGGPPGTVPIETRPAMQTQPDGRVSFAPAYHDVPRDMFATDSNVGVDPFDLARYDARDPRSDGGLLNRGLFLDDIGALPSNNDLLNRGGARSYGTGADPATVCQGWV